MAGIVGRGFETSSELTFGFFNEMSVQVKYTQQTGENLQIIRKLFLTIYVGSDKSNFHTLEANHILTDLTPKQLLSFFHLSNPSREKTTIVTEGSVTDTLGTLEKQFSKIEFTKQRIIEFVARSGILVVHIKNRGDVTSYMFDGKGNSYTGDMNGDIPHGFGELNFEDGSYYKGRFRDGGATGPGILKDKKNNYYVGDVKNLQPHGKGTYTSFEWQTVHGLFEGGKLVQPLEAVKPGREKESWS